MSRPPRIANWLPWEKRTIYFITFCVNSRKPVLANAKAWEICRAVFDKLDEWRILSAIAMPDHLYILAAPLSRDACISDFSKWFKRWFNEAYRTSNCHLPERASGWIGDGRKDVSIGCCDLTNRSRKNGNTFAKIRCELAWWNIQRTGHIGFNSMLRSLASDTDALQFPSTTCRAVVRQPRYEGGSPTCPAVALREGGSACLRG
jgi:REP element-mobilizing transposase RayT